jgi:nucleotidyltransferase/DNA polymerase involved in DNA repair
MRLLHLFWPHLPLRLARSRCASSTANGQGAVPDPSTFPDGPIVLGGQPWTAGSVIDASPEAEALGVRRGMALGNAHRLAPEAAFLDPDRETDAAAIETALDCLARFSPGVAGPSDVDDLAFGRLEAQVDGLDRLWGVEPVLVARVRAALEDVLPGTPRAAIAGTRFAAMVAASVRHPDLPSNRSVIVAPGGDAAFLEPLPASLLSTDPEVRGRLARFGLRTIGAITELPRTALVARFGAEGERLHARARGEETDPFRPRRAPERMTLALPIDPPVDGLESLRFVLHRLAGALADQLLARGAATARVRLRLELDRTFAPEGIPTSQAIAQRLPEPTAEAEAIERLLLARLERTPPPAPVARLELELEDVAPATGQQLALFVPQAGRLTRLGWQLARLALTFGEDRIRTVELTDPEMPLPERRWNWRPIASGAVEETVS